MNITFSMSIVD